MRIFPNWLLKLLYAYFLPPDIPFNDTRISGQNSFVNIDIFSPIILDIFNDEIFKKIKDEDKMV